MTFTPTPVDTSTPTPIPMSSVVPDGTNTPLPVEGGPAKTTGGNTLAPAATYQYDGYNETMGHQSDAAWSGSGSGSEIAILKKIVAGQTGTASVTQSTGAPQGTAWRTEGDYLEVPFSTTTAQVVANTDAANYRWVEVIITSQGTGSTVTFQVSGNNSAYVSAALQSVGSQSGSATALAPTTTGIWHGPLGARYFQLNVTGISAGTTAGIVRFHTLPAALQAMSVSATEAGTWTVQPGNTPNTTPWLVSAGPPADLTLLASAAQTTTQTLADQANFAGKGIRVVLDVTAAGTGSITLEIDAKDVASGKYVALLTGLAVTTISTNVYVIHPELTAAANSIAKDVLPHTWRVKVTANNANPVTYSVGASYLN